MNKEARGDILEVLTEAILALENDDVKKLKELSDKTIHAMTIYQSEEPILVAIVLYTASKVYERSKYHTYQDWDYVDAIVRNNLIEAKKKLEKNDNEGYLNSLKNILKKLGRVESKLGKYISEIVERTKINKASRLYEHGLSSGVVKELLGVTGWELAEYTGTTGIADRQEGITESISRRLKVARGIFS
ncbi:hypothetical protein J4403_03305 [Candidatus Woesearchaeota archaeon]|nr:hypothetical protein [Candidatus Woesearchaeota archaeon]